MSKSLPLTALTSDIGCPHLLVLTSKLHDIEDQTPGCPQQCSKTQEREKGGRLWGAQVREWGEEQGIEECMLEERKNSGQTAFH